MAGEQAAAAGGPRRGRGSAQPQSSRELKFRRLARELRRRIIDGTWPPASKLPTEQALSTESGMSVTTVRRAYEELQADGLVVRRQGAGTFVAAEVTPARAGRRAVGVLVPDTTMYYPRVLRGIEEAISEAGARSVLACSHYDPRAEDDAIGELLGAGVDGLLLVPSLHELADPAARVGALRALPVPVVLVERRLASAGPGDPMEYVCSDHQGGAYDAVSHLHALGHRRIGLVLRTDAPTAAAISTGFERAAADFALEQAARHQDRMAAWDADRADAALAALLEDGATAVLCLGDPEATLLLGAARRVGVRVPEDLSAVAYDDETADIAEVPLTAVSPPRFRLGKLAGNVLLQRLEHGEALPVHQLFLRPRLVVRASSGRARHSRAALFPEASG